MTTKWQRHAMKMASVSPLLALKTKIAILKFVETTTFARFVLTTVPATYQKNATAQCVLPNLA